MCRSCSGELSNSRALWATVAPMAQLQRRVIRLHPPKQLLVANLMSRELRRYRRYLTSRCQMILTAHSSYLARTQPPSTTWGRTGTAWARPFSLRKAGNGSDQRQVKISVLASHNYSIAAQVSSHHSLRWFHPIKSRGTFLRRRWSKS